VQTLKPDDVPTTPRTGRKKPAPLTISVLAFPDEFAAPLPTAAEAVIEALEREARYVAGRWGQGDPIAAVWAAAVRVAKDALRDQQGA
jgi:hypothetical protein